jgi:hypothetical protein
VAVFVLKKVAANWVVCLGLKCSSFNGFFVSYFQIPGYTRKEGAVWYYSYKAISLVQNYMQEFPELFEHLAKHTGNDVFYESDVFSAVNEMG